MAMTRDDIIRMAKEAGFDIDTIDIGAFICVHGIVVSKKLEDFAAIVAAAEREKCVKELKIHGWGYASKILSPKGNNGL